MDNDVSWVNAFLTFISTIWIDTKEYGRIPFRPNGAQQHILHEIIEGMKRGIRQFISLKCRQIGNSTLMVVLDVFWAHYYSGIQMGIIFDSDENRDYFRGMIKTILTTMPEIFKVPIREHNRNGLWLENRSVIVYMVAGTKKKNTLGQGKGLNYIHSMEVSSYGDVQGLLSLTSALAETYPHRLYVWESTAKGYNHFKDMWDDAKDSVSWKAIFTTWWHHEGFRISRDDQRFDIYGDHRPTSDERLWMEEVRQEYGYQITDEQLAWWKWKLKEEFHNDLVYLYQEWPPHEDYAFRMTGSLYFDPNKLSIEMRGARRKKYATFYFEFNRRHTDPKNFYDTQIIVGRTKNDLKIWEPPKPNGIYSVGVDPAYGSSGYADANAISILRCYADKAVQVAEYRNNEVNPHQLAWITIYLAGHYAGYWPSKVNVEVNGPGKSVIEEIRAVIGRRGVFTPKNDDNRSMFNVPHKMAMYLYRRVDTPAGGYAYGILTTEDTKDRYMSNFKSMLENGLIELSSDDLIKEMSFISRDRGLIVTEANKKDDRVIAMALAVMGWQQMLPQMQSPRFTFKNQQEEDLKPPGEAPKPTSVTVMQNAIARHFGKRLMRSVRT